MITGTNYSGQLRFSDEIRAVRWNKRGSCGTPGCPDTECCCSLCRQPIGTDEEASVWETHDKECVGCEICENQIPIILWRGLGKNCKQAQFHVKCFSKLLHPQSIDSKKITK